MEVHLTPDAERKHNDFAAQSGRGANDVVEDALAGYFEEVAQTRQTLNSRYDDLKNGTVKPISRDEMIAYFREKSAAARLTTSGS